MTVYVISRSDARTEIPFSRWERNEEENICAGDRFFFFYAFEETIFYFNNSIPLRKRQIDDDTIIYTAQQCVFLFRKNVCMDVCVFVYVMSECGRRQATTGRMRSTWDTEGLVSDERPSGRSLYSGAVRARARTSVLCARARARSVCVRIRWERAWWSEGAGNAAAAAAAAERLV